MASMSALVLRIVFSCSFPFFLSFLLFCVCLPLSRFFHSRYFCSKQRIRSCSHPLMGSVYTCSQASKPDSLRSQNCILPLPFSYPLPHPSFASLISWVFPALPCSWRAAVPRCGHIWLGIAWVLALMRSSCWTLGQSLISRLMCFIHFNHTIFRERDSLLLFVITHYSTTQLPCGSRHHMLL